MPERRAVVDEDLPRIIDTVLEGLGWHVFDVRDFGLRGRSDREVIRFAHAHRAVLFTGDWGFANIVNYPPRRYRGIVILNFPNELSTRIMAEETARALLAINHRRFQHNLIIIEPGRLRVREG